MSHEKKYQPYSYSKERNANNTPYTLAEGENLLECPYDKNHQVLDTKATTHFLKCHNRHVQERQAAHLPPLFKICKFSRLHHLRVENYQAHLLTCPERMELDAEETGFDDSVVPKFYLEPKVHKPVVKRERGQSHSNWDFNPDIADDANFDSDQETARVQAEENWETYQNPRRKYDFKVREQQMSRFKQPIGLTKSQKKERREEIVENRNPNLWNKDEWS